MRFADRGEEFLGIGMDAPASLNGGEVIMSDSARLVVVYPYRDADHSEITPQTQNLMLVSCGVPGISVDQIEAAAERASEFVLRFCGGEVSR